jgi:long-subunit acyl-CoA synthetase (AMP-forming)
MNGIPDQTIDGCATIPQLFRKRIEQHPGKTALREKDLGIWNEYSWRDWGEQARLVGLGLIALGLERGDRCSIASEINKEWLFADLGIICAGGITNARPRCARSSSSTWTACVRCRTSNASASRNCSISAAATASGFPMRGTTRSRAPGPRT